MVGSPAALCGFALNLHRRLRDQAAGRHGFAWSPYSVWCSLAMAAVGARGPTAEELAGALAPGLRPDDIESLLLGMPALAEKDDGTAVVAANTAWLDATFDVDDGYLATMKRWANGDVRSTDLREHPEPSRVGINAGVADATRGLIPDLIPPGAIDPDTALVLVNALYLRAGWAETFATEATAGGTFQAPGGPTTAAMMHGEFKARYAAGQGWQAVELRTASEHVAVAALLPDGDLDEAEDRLAPETLLELFAALQPANVSLTLPRFHTGLHQDLRGALTGLGVRRAFSDGADFGGISESGRLKIGFVTHGAVFTLNEAGIEAAAATATGIRLISALLAPHVSLVVDRPFLVTVRDPESGALLFIGRVTHPEEEP